MNASEECTRPSLTAYQDYRAFLRDLYRQKKTASTRYSYRKFAEELGFGPSNHLHLVIRGRRNFSPQGVSKVAEALSLSSFEKKLLANLVSENQTRDPVLKKKLQDDRKAMIARRPSLLSENQHVYFSKWYYPIVREV